jgi:DEAD/DEAH box helicase domain-containing protein
MISLGSVARARPGTIIAAVAVGSNSVALLSTSPISLLDRHVRYVSCSANLSGTSMCTKTLQSLCETRLKRDADSWYGYWYRTHLQFLPYPANLKELKYIIVDVTRVSRGGAAEVLEEIEDSRVLFEAFEGTVFLHQGLTREASRWGHKSRC